MKTYPNLEQGSPEWHEWRAKRCMASQAPVIMGATPSYYSVRTWADLRAEQAGMGAEVSEETKRAWEHGKVNEAKARKYLNVNMWDYEPVCGECETDSRFAASFDGVDGDMGWCEIKCPVSGERSTMLKLAESYGEGQENYKDCIPPHIWWQLVHQAAVYTDEGRRNLQEGCICVYLVYLTDDRNALLRVDISNLLADWPALKAEWERFLNGEAQGRDDSEWRDLANAWTLADKAAKESKDKLDIARNGLLDLAKPNGGDEGAGVKVMRIESKGSIDWEKIARELWSGALPSAQGDYEIEPTAETYRKPAREAWKISPSKK